MCSCSIKCLKITSFVCTVLLLLSSLVQILYGSYYLAFLHLTMRPETLSHPVITIPPLAVLLCGIVLLFLLCLGCTGLIKEVKCCVNLYSAVLLALFIIHLVLGCVLLWHFIGTTLEDLEDKVVRDLNRTFKDHAGKSKDYVNNIQSLFKCCGLQNKDFWETDVVIESCCVTESTCLKNSTEIYQVGCQDKLTNFINFNSSITAFASFPIAFMELLTAIFAVCWSYLDGQYVTSYKM